MSKKSLLENCEVILGNSNKNLSGVTTTMLSTMRYQRKDINLVIMGGHHVSEQELVVSFWDVVKHCRKPPASGNARVFHARRNDEMIQALLLRALGVPLCIVFTSTAQRNHTWITRFLMSKVDYVISTCNAAASYLKSPPSAIIPHGIDISHFEPAEDREAAWKALGFGGEYGIGILGRVRAQKGVPLLVRSAIELCPKYPGLTAIVAGAVNSSNESFVAQMKAEIDAAGLSDRILFVGEVSFDDIPRYFQALSIGCALSWVEGFGLTILEAMGSQTAVVATRAGAWEDIIRPGIDGELVPIEGQKELNETLDKMLSDRAKLEEMGKAGRQRVLEHYTVEREAAQLVDFYRRAATYSA